MTEEYQTVDNIDVSFASMRRIAELSIKHEASFSIWKEYADNAVATGEFDVAEAHTVLGHAVMNDHMLDAIIDSIAREVTKEAHASIQHKIDFLKSEVEDVVNADGDPSQLNREIYVLEHAIQALTPEVMRKGVFD